MSRRVGAIAAAVSMIAIGVVANGPAHAEDYRVTFKIGTKPVIENGDGRAYARYYLNYIAHAVESYRDLDDKSPYAKLPGNFDKQGVWEKTTDAVLTTLRNNVDLSLKKRWTFVGGYSGVLLCRIGDPACLMRPIPARGLAYQFWKRKDCSRLAIVFRGTDPTSFSDWYANFRWVTRVLPFADEYDIVRQNIDRIVDEARLMSGCPATAPIFAVGHSLGGGLAQLAAYSHSGIRHVYAFNSSPVTAFYDVDQLTRERNKKDLIIDRVYEKGEILVLPRRLTELFYQPSECDPQVRTVEFNTESGIGFDLNPISQHSIDRLWAGLSDFARKATKKLRIPGLTNERPTGCEPVTGVRVRVAKGEKKTRSARRVAPAAPQPPLPDRLNTYAAIQ